MDIPLVDLAWQHAQVEREVREGFERVLARGAFILGEEVATFEQAYAAFSGVAHCIGVSSGTDALELSLRAHGIGPTDEVILPANTFIATALAVVRAGATPVLCDVEDEFLLIDVEDARARVTSATRAIIPVHLYGQMAPMADVRAFADEHELLVLEDAAQAQGATQDGQPPGSTIAATSFYPGKNLGAYGDAGAILTNDAAVVERLRAMRNWGSDVKYHHPEIGFNSRLDTLQAVVLQAKLAHLSQWNQLRTVAANRYAKLLSDVDGVRLPRTIEGNAHVWHLFVVRVDRRDQVAERMHADGIGVGVHYPYAIHEQKAFAARGGTFPIAEAAARSVLSLPIFPGITEENQVKVVASLKRAVS